MRGPLSSDEFEAELAANRTALRAYVFRMIGISADADDLLQETLLKAYQKKDSLKNTSSFRSWIFRIATTTCLDHLRRKTRWRPYSQRYIEDSCHEDEAKLSQVVGAVQDPEFAYDVREHLSFCFTCVGRSLPPEQQAAIMLRELFGYSNKEAAEILDVTQSVLKHHLADGRQAMEKTFEGLCSLINKDGVCRQCASFRSSTREGRRGPSLPVIDSNGGAWRGRVDVVAQSGFEGGVSDGLHRLLFQLIDDLESAY